MLYTKGSQADYVSDVPKGPLQQLLKLPLTHQGDTIPLHSRGIPLIKALPSPRPDFISSTDHPFLPLPTSTKITSFNINGFINKNWQVKIYGMGYILQSL